MLSRLPPGIALPNCTPVKTHALSPELSGLSKFASRCNAGEAVKPPCSNSRAASLSALKIWVSAELVVVPSLATFAAVPASLEGIVVVADCVNQLAALARTWSSRLGPSVTGALAISATNQRNSSGHWGSAKSRAKRAWSCSRSRVLITPSRCASARAKSASRSLWLASRPSAAP